jgi:hypothetical protein
LCWKKSKRKLLTLLSERPSIADWWSEMEIKYANTAIRDRGPGNYNFHRDNASTLDVVALSKQPFIPVTDPFWKNNASCEMDDESPCACVDDL